MKLDARGFTLIEAVLSIGVIAAGLIGLLYAYQRSVSSSLLADQSLVATSIARETMEKIIAQKDCDNAGCGYVATLLSITTGTYNANPVTGFPGYALTATATEISPGLITGVDDFLVTLVGSGYARVTVRVTWNSGSNFIQLVTLTANY